MSTLTISADYESISDVRHWLRAFFKENNYNDGEKCYEWELVLTETVTNIIEHGEIEKTEADIELVAEKTELNISLSIRDNGKRYDFHALEGNSSEKIKEERPPGGMGVFLIRKLVDKVEQSVLADGRNQLVLIKQK